MGIYSITCSNRYFEKCPIIMEFLFRFNAFFSLYNLATLFLIYTTVLIAFGLSYVVLEEMGFAVLKEDGESLNAHSFQLVEVCLYFSAVTLLSVGYGDISPIGIGRWIAIAEALIGYTLPFAFVMRSVIDNEK